MTLLHNCDDLINLGLHPYGGAVVLENDFTNFQEGFASVLMGGDALSDYAHVALDVSGVLPNWTNVKSLNFSLKGLDYRYNFGIAILAPDWANKWLGYYSVSALNVWENKVLDFPAAWPTVHGAPDLANVTTLLFRWSNNGLSRRWKIDAIEVAEVIVTYLLTVESSQITGVPVTVDGTLVDGTPLTAEVSRGVHKIKVPLEVEVP